mgnify:CR=1 FL=1
MSTQHIKMGGAPEGYDAQLVLRELHSHGEPVVHIARDDKRMSAMAEVSAIFKLHHAALATDEAFGHLTCG